MECPACKSANPDGNKFCGECGARLVAQEAGSDGDLRNKIKAMLKEELKDQKVVEVEIAESVADRVTNWAKLAGFFVGIPLALTVVVLGGFGVYKVSDLWRLIGEAEKRVAVIATDVTRKEEALKQLQPKIDAIAAAGQRVENMEKDFGAKLAKTEKSLEEKVANLGAKFDQRAAKLEGQVEDIKKAIEIVGRSFNPAEFQAYVSKLDFSFWRPEFIVLHHTMWPSLAQWRKMPREARLKQIANFATFFGQKGWHAGPHLFIDDEAIWVFSPLTKPGVHTPSWNAVSIGIEMIGDYSSEPLDENVRENTVRAIAILDSALKIKADTLHFHRDDPGNMDKDCPGKNVSKEDFITRVDATLTTGATLK
jgi:N-acetylmuramoyl-L-alanine amidase